MKRNTVVYGGYALNQFGRIKPSWGKVAACTVLALFLGLFQPLALMFQVMMPMPGICVATVASVVMYAGAGAVPVVVFATVAAVSSLLLFGLLPGAASLLLWLFPAVVMISGMHKKRPFFSQLRNSIIVSVAITALAVAVMALIFGQNMIGAAIDQLRYYFEGQKELFWEVLSPMFRSAEGSLSMEEFVETYYQMFNILQLYYEYYLLANLLGGAAISAMVGVLWGNWQLARRGEVTTESFRGLSEWYLSSNTTYGILLTLIASKLLSLTSMAGAETAWMVVSTLGSIAFAVQCMAAMDRRMKRNGSSVGRRIFLLVLLAVFGSSAGAMLFGMELMDLLAIAGCASALFGSRGAAKPMIQKIKNNMDGEDR